MVSGKLTFCPVDVDAVLPKIVTRAGGVGKLYVPKAWIGSKVLIVKIKTELITI